MNKVNLAFKSIQHKSLHSMLTILAIVMAVSILIASFLMSTGIAEGLKRNSAGVDMVAGAKGSPLQLILSTIYHVDVPTGNIDISELEKIKKHPLVKQAVPLVVGDNYKGWRVVGTTPEFLNLYDASLKEGHMFQKTFEVIAGSATGLKIGEEFAARHGFYADSDDVHDDHLYTVVGILNSTGTTIDRLLITDVKAVQELHSHHDHHHDEDEEDMGHQITAILMKVRNHAALMNLPRVINQQEHMQVANPAYELTRFSKNFGLGRDVFMTLGASLLGLSALMLFAMLASSLVNRRKDVAVMRVMGASPLTAFFILMFEGLIIAALGTIIGIICGHALAYSVTDLLGSFEGILIKENLIRFHMFDALILIVGCCVGIIAALPAALSVAKTDITKLLAKG